MYENNERDNRLAVMTLYTSGVKVKDICIKVGLSRSTVYSIVRKFQDDNTIERCRGSGKFFKLSSDDISFLKEKIQINNRLSFPKLAKILHQEKGVNVSK